MKSSLAKLALGAALVSVACRDNSANARARADSDLARDLALAGAQTQQPQATFKDTSISPEPTRAATSPKPEVPAPVKRRTEPKPAPKPRVVAQTPAPEPPPVAVPQIVTPAPAPAAIHAEIGAGAAAAMTSGSKICTNSNLPGDKLTATLNTALTGSNGAVIPAGSTVVLELASATPGKDGKSPELTFRVRSIVVNDKTYDVQAEASPLDALQQTKVANSDPNAEKKKVVGGAIAGAILGQIIGHNTKGTLIGAAAGAATGAAVSRGTEKYEACLPAGAAMRLKLDAPLIIS